MKETKIIDITIDIDPKKIILILIMLFLIGYLFFKHSSSNEEISKFSIEKKSILLDTVRIETFTEANLILYMKVLEIEYPNIVLAQAKLESANFTSNRFKQHNALFGFQTSNDNIIKYKSWKQSVINYKNWQMRRLKDGENYYDFLIRVKYSEDPNYINKLKQF